MPPDKPTDVKATTWVIVVVFVAVLALIGTIFAGSGNRIFDGDEPPDNQGEVHALQTQVAGQATLIAQQEPISTPAMTDGPIIQATETETPPTSSEGSEEIPPPTAITATLPTMPPASNTPEAVTSIVPVWAIEENGVRIDISASGIYKVEYLNDAYSPWPNEQSEGYRGWTTIVRIYRNRPVEWGPTDYGLTGPINHDDYLSPGGYFLDKAQAISSATGDSRTFRLQAGDYLVFVPLDEKGRYTDNQGKIDIGITYLEQ